MKYGDNSHDPTERQFDNKIFLSVSIDDINVKLFYIFTQEVR